MHPKDTGGSFFEIDEQLGEGAHDLDGPWLPAGGAGWKAAQRLERVREIVAAEIQAEGDPAKLAARWGEIAELPVRADANGNPSIQLDNARLRFVAATDGRGEGLGGLDLRVTGRDAVLAGAKARNAYRSDSQVYVCGMRMNLV
jgi:hypothetical protein